MVVASQYLADMDQLVHFVIGPEGIWVIHLTPGFQTILKVLKESQNIECGNAIFVSCVSNFVKVLIMIDDITTDPIERYKASDRYLSAVKHYRVSNCFLMYLLLNIYANLSYKKNVRLFDVNLLKLETF